MICLMLVVTMRLGGCRGKCTTFVSSATYKLFEKTDWALRIEHQSCQPICAVSGKFSYHGLSSPHIRSLDAKGF